MTRQSYQLNQMLQLHGPTIPLCTPIRKGKERHQPTAAGAHQARTRTPGRCGSRPRWRRRSPRPLSPVSQRSQARARTETAGAQEGGRRWWRGSRRRRRGACSAALASLEPGNPNLAAELGSRRGLGETGNWRIRRAKGRRYFFSFLLESSKFLVCFVVSFSSSTNSEVFYPLPFPQPNFKILRLDQNGILVQNLV